MEDVGGQGRCRVDGVALGPCCDERVDLGGEPRVGALVTEVLDRPIDPAEAGGVPSVELPARGAGVRSGRLQSSSALSG